MRRVEKTVFISYRRADEAWALAIYNTLKQCGFDVFIDYLGIGSGSFEREIVENIGARAHFLVLLTPHALDRVDKSEDWMRREIECAIDLKRNVIPVMLDKFSFDEPGVQARLTGKLALLQQYNGLSVPAGYFESAMQRLEGQYLNVEVDTVLHPLSADARQSASRQQAAADKATTGIDPRTEDLGARLAADDEILGKPSMQSAADSGQVSQKITEKIAETLPPPKLPPKPARFGVPLLIAVASLTVGLGIYATMARKPDLLARLHLVGGAWHTLQFLGGLAAAVCLFALFKFYAAYSGKTLGRTIEIGGPGVLLFAVVALGFWALPEPLLPLGTELSITITAPAADKLHFSTRGAPGNPEWSLAIQPKLINSLAERVLRLWQDEDARMLASLLLPTEMRTLVSNAGETHLHLIVNQDTANYPWEALFGSANRRVKPVSVIRSLAGVTPATVQRPAAATALLISDPSTRGTPAEFGVEVQLPELPYTRLGSAAVATILSKAGFSVVQSEGSPAGTVFEKFFGTDYYRVVLIAAHGVHEYELPGGVVVTGVLLDNGAMITAQEFDQMSVPPDLVFLNTLHLARIGNGPDREASLQRSLPVRLLRSGVRTVIASDGLVDDQVAMEFSKTFFESLVNARQTVEEAVLTARRQSHLRFPHRCDWAAYQLYGVGGYRIGATE